MNILVVINIKYNTAPTLNAIAFTKSIVVATPFLLHCGHHMPFGIYLLVRINLFLLVLCRKYQRGYRTGRVVNTFIPKTRKTDWRI